MGIHNELSYAKYTSLEAEMRRRLWWSLIIFDDRIHELSGYKASVLDPTWECRIPLNVNDSDIRPEMKIPPAAHEKPTDALFAVVRSELAEFVSHSAFHLDFINPSLKAIARNHRYGSTLEGSELIPLEKAMEEKYIEYCNPENRLHFMTIWTTRGYLARKRLLEHYSIHSRSSMQQTDTQRDAAISHALGVLECDTKLMTSPLTKGYLWLVNIYFPFPAYIHIVQDLRKRPISEHAGKAWEVMSNNYDARFMNVKQHDNVFLKIFLRHILHAWKTRETVFKQLDKPLKPPRFVSDNQVKVTQMTPSAQKSDGKQPNSTLDMSADDFSIPMQMDFGGLGLPYDLGGQDSAGLGHGGYPDLLREFTMDVDVNQLDWTTID